MSLNLDKSTWKRVTLGDVAEASNEKCDPADGEVERYVAGEHMDTDDLKVHRWGEVGDGYLGPAFHRRFRSGQVLYGSRRTYLRKVAVADFDGVCANTTFVVETRDARVFLPEFLPFVMTAEPFHAFAIRESKGSVNPYVNWSDIARYEFDLPPVDQQRRVAGLLWALERHRRRVEALRAGVIRARLIQLDEALTSGAAHDNWPMLTIPDLVTSGPTNGKSATANDEQRGIPTLSISAVRDGRIIGGAAVKYIDVPATDVANYVLRDDDFLVIRGNGNKQLTGRGGLVRGGLPKGCVYPDLLIRLRFDEAKMLPEFAALQWNGQRAHTELLKNAKSTNGIWKINGKDIKGHALLAPPLAEQRRILDELAISDTTLARLKSECDSLVALRSALSDSIFGGAS